MSDLKRVLSLCLVLAMALSLMSAAALAAEEPALDGDGYTYYTFDSGSEPVAETPGWHYEPSYGDNAYTYYDENGSQVFGWVKDNGKWYYMGAEGLMTTYALEIDGRNYYFDPKSGAMQTGWVNAPTYGTWFYGDKSGAGHNGWLQDGGKWYYFVDGWMVTGSYDIGGKSYLFSSGGAMQTGWVKDGGFWKYYNADGSLQKGWKQLGGKWYYFQEPYGYMAAGDTMINGDRYYFGADGAMLSGGWHWVAWDNGNQGWAYFENDGRGHDGWLGQGGNWYYLEQGDLIVGGWYFVGGDCYWFDANGVMRTGWQSFVDDYGRTCWMYFDSDGRSHVGWLQEGSTWYWFPRQGSYVIL